jgi:hypothetical protein
MRTLLRRVGGTERECETLYLSQEENREIFSGRVSLSTRSSFRSSHIGEGAVSEVKFSAFCRTEYFHSLYLPGFLSTYINQKPVRIIEIFKKKSVLLTHKSLPRPVGSCRSGRFSNIVYYFEVCFTALLKPVSEYTASIIRRLLNDEFERIWKETVVIYSKYSPGIFLGRMSNTTINLMQDVWCAEHRVCHF